MQREVAKGLLALLERDNDLSRCWAAKALGAIGASEAVPSLIERLYQDPDPDVRMEAIAALGTLAAPESTDALIDSLHNDPDGDVKIQACIALGKIGNRKALDTLIAALTDEESFAVDDWDEEEGLGFDAVWEIQHQALERLGDIGDERAVTPIVQLLRDDTYEDLQEMGFHVLAKIGSAQARDFLLQQLQEGSALARRRAAKALTNVHDSDVTQALSKALQDRDPDVCIAAALALATCRDPSVSTSLINLLQHPHEDVRREAAAVVATLPGEEVREHLRRLLDDGKRGVQQQAVRLLGEMGDVKATEKLISLFETSRADVTFCNDIIKALGTIGAPEATAPLCRRFNDDQLDDESRLQIVLALGNIVKPAEEASDAVDLLITSIGDVDEKVCLASLLALEKIGGDRAAKALDRALRGDLPEMTPEIDASRPNPQSDIAPSFPTSTLAAMQTQYASSLPADDLAERRNRVRRYTARLIRQTSDPALVDDLLQAAQADDMELQREALLSLGHLGEPRAAAVALQHLTSGSRETQLAAIDAIEMLHPANIVDALLKVLSSASDTFVCQRIIEVLGILGDPRATDLIAQRLHDVDRQVRRVALQALATLGNRDISYNIKPLLFARSGELRIEAISALKSLGDTTISGELLDVLNDPEDEEYHWIAIEALTEFYKATT